MQNSAAREEGWLRVLGGRQAQDMAPRGARCYRQTAGPGPPTRSRPVDERRRQRQRRASLRLRPARHVQRRSPALAAPRRRQGHPPIRDFRPRAGPGKDDADEAEGPAEQDGRGKAGTPRFERRPQLMMLSTDSDRPLDWLHAGQALQHALLTATRYGVSASFLTQPLELHDARSLRGGPANGPESPGPGAKQQLLELPAGRRMRLAPAAGRQTRFRHAPAALAIALR